MGGLVQSCIRKVTGMYAIGAGLGEYWRAAFLLASAPADAIRDLGLRVYCRVRNDCAVEVLRVGRKNLRAVSQSGESNGKHRALHAR